MSDRFPKAFPMYIQGNWFKVLNIYMSTGTICASLFHRFLTCQYIGRYFLCHESYSQVNSACHGKYCRLVIHFFWRKYNLWTGLKLAQWQLTTHKGFMERLDLTIHRSYIVVWKFIVHIFCCGHSSWCACQKNCFYALPMQQCSKKWKS